MAQLQRRLYRIDALAVALGAVIGVGIFRSTGVVLSGTGGFAGATALWIVVGVVCLAGAVLYADLSGRVPEAGGPYAYTRVAFGGPAAFVYGWMNAGVSMPVRHASTFAVIGELLARRIPLDPRLLGAIVLVLLAAINLIGVRAGAITQRVFTTGKLATLALIIGLGLYLGATGSDEAPAVFTRVSFPLAVAACWYTYLAWQDVVLLAEELREPRRDLPVVLVGTVGLTMVLYITVHATVYFGLDGGTAAYSATPAVEVARRVLGGAGAALLTGLTLSSMIGGAAEGMLVRPRLAMSLARDGLGPAPVAAIDRRGTPYGALLFHAALALGLVLTGSFVELLPLMAFAQGFLGIFETAAYFAVRKARPELPTSRFHPWAPLLFIVVNVALCVLAAVENPWSMAKAFGLLAVISLMYLVARPRTIAAEPARQFPEATVRDSAAR